MPREGHLVGDRADQREQASRAVDGLGNDYYTFSDTNIEYIWRFLGVMNERGWLYQGYRSTEWCPRWDVDVAARAVPGRRLPGENRPSIYVRFPLRERAGEELVIWTTTPWTLPANVAPR